MEEEKIKIVTRTQVYLDDPEFFCNKSWTLSFNFNTKSWVSFHSYLPNWYIGENNFFYSGVNGGCDDAEIAFDMLTGVINRGITTTTTTIVPMSTTTTSTTTIVIDCDLEGEGYIVECDLAGTAVITVPPTTTTTTSSTTICERLFPLTTVLFYHSYTLGVDPIVNFTSSSVDSCAAIQTILDNVETIIVDYYTVKINMVTIGVFEEGQSVYDDGFGCTYIADGWYIDANSLTTNNTYHVVGGVIVEILAC